MTRFLLTLLFLFFATPVCAQTVELSLDPGPSWELCDDQANDWLDENRDMEFSNWGAKTARKPSSNPAEYYLTEIECDIDGDIGVVDPCSADPTYTPPQGGLCMGWHPPTNGPNWEYQVFFEFLVANWDDDTTDQIPPYTGLFRTAPKYLGSGTINKDDQKFSFAYSTLQYWGPNGGWEDVPTSNYQYDDTYRFDYYLYLDVERRQRNDQCGGLTSTEVEAKPWISTFGRNIHLRLNPNTSSHWYLNDEDN